MKGLTGIGAALKGMFLLRPNNKAHREMLANLDELRSVSGQVQASEVETEFERTMRRITAAAGKRP